MDFAKSVEVHVNWKRKLATYITKPDRSLDAVTVGQDNRCELGQWLQGEGRKFAKSPEFAKLAADHTRFHKAAADIIRKADSGQCMTEEVCLGSKSEYASASNAVVSHLMKMNRESA